MISREEYRLTLFHTYIDADGHAHSLESPIVVKQIIPFGDDKTPQCVVVNKMLEEMKRFVLLKCEQ